MRIRKLLCIALATTATAALHTGVSAAALDLTDPNDVIRAQIKLSCSHEPGEDAVYWWQGKMYSRRPGEKDRHLFNVQGMNVRQCAILQDPKKGMGYRSVSREVMFYLDPETNEVVDTWVNPWSGEEVEVIQVANDPVNMQLGDGRFPIYAYNEDGTPRARWTSFEHEGFYLNGGGAARLFYDNPLAGDYQEYVGGTYHAMEFGTGAVPIDHLLDGDAPHVSDRVISWARVSKFLPWMKMGDRDGVVIFHTAGLRLESWDDLPAVVKDEILENYPAYVTAPPLDDDRPNETSWTVTKRAIDAKRAAEE